MGGNSLIRKIKAVAAATVMVSTMAIPSAALNAGAGDLLVAPTRIIFDGQRGAEVLLNNIGSEVATYRVSLELRRMTAEGTLEEVTKENANAKEAAALDMLRYAPRRVTLPPNQPQSVRLGVRAPAGLEDGEYRVHMLFRAIPKAKAVTQPVAPGSGVSISITPIYGVTIPVIIRQGNLQATAGIANPRVENDERGPVFAFDLSRSGDRSTYGEIRVMKQGQSEPILLARGIAVYSEVNERKVSLPVSPEIAAQIKGPISVEYYEPANTGGSLIAKTQMVLR